MHQTRMLVRSSTAKQLAAPSVNLSGIDFDSSVRCTYTTEWLWTVFITYHFRPIDSSVAIPHHSQIR